MSKLLHRYSSSTRLAEDGKEFQLSDEGWITLRRQDSKIVTAHRKEQEDPYRSLINSGGQIPEDKLRSILASTAAQAIVVSFRGSDWFDDAEAEAGLKTEEQRKAWLEDQLNNPDQAPLMNQIYALSGDYANFRDEQVKQVKGN